MKSTSRFLSSCVLAAALASSVSGMACHGHRSYRVYDPYYSDYHAWNSTEVDYYHRWAGENHRDADRDFRSLKPEEQKEYWTCELAGRRSRRCPVLSSNGRWLNAPSLQKYLRRTPYADVRFSPRSIGYVVGDK
jgi:hypothetical protein